VDVAQALGVSHGVVYRHFPSKAALRDAVTERWLTRLVAPLEARRNRAGLGAGASSPVARAVGRIEAAEGPRGSGTVRKLRGARR
jgi:AcrR family transcriptional regulator